MNVSSSNSPGPVVRDVAVVDALREVLRAADYTATGVARRLPAVRTGLRGQDVPLYERRVSGDDPLSVLIRLFLLGVPVARAEAERALAPLALQDLQEAMVLAAVDRAVTSLTQLQVRVLPGSSRRCLGGSVGAQHWSLAARSLCIFMVGCSAAHRPEPDMPRARSLPHHASARPRLLNRQPIADVFLIDAVHAA